MDIRGGMVSTTRAYIERHGLFPGGGRVIAGVSGGPDSMVLLDVLLRLQRDVFVVHVNYGLRGRASDADAELVRTFARARGVSLLEVDVRGEIDSSRERGSMQARARHLRYERFAAVAAEEGIDVVAVGHNRDDQVETVLLNLMRGAGLDGLGGMRPQRKLRRDAGTTLARPFLETGREEIRSYARDADIPWRQDASNEDLRYARVRLRNDVIPALVRVAGEDVIDEVLSMASELRILTDEILPAHLPRALRTGLTSGRLPVEPLSELDPFVRGGLLLRCLRSGISDAPARRTSIEAIEKLLASRSGKRVQFKGGAVWRERDHLRILTSEAGPSAARDSGGGAPSPEATVHYDGGDGSLSGPFGTLAWQTSGAVPSDATVGLDEILVDAGALRGPLSVRPWRPGDRFVPFGMSGSKKVKAFLTDRKVASSERATTRLLLDGDRIVWVIGLAMDDRYRIGSDTERVVRISWSPPVEERR